MSLTTHCERALREQVHILCKHIDEEKVTNYRFIREHSLVVLQLSELILNHQEEETSATKVA